MENQTYLQLLKNAFHILFEKYNYKIVHHVASDPFWNAQTFLQSDQLLLQIVNDWCQISLDLKSYDTNKPLKKQFNDFYDFGLVLEFLEIPEKKDLEALYEKVLTDMFSEDSEWYNVVEKESGVIQMNLIAEIFERNYEKILDIFTVESIFETKTKLASIRKERAKS